MRLTTRGRYAVTALLDLALQDSPDNAVSLSDIAKRQEISISYLEQLFSKLRKKGLVVSTRGASGGYHIAKPLDQINIMNIICAVDESVDARACDGQGNCQEGAMCLTHYLWTDLSQHIEDYLSKVTLAELIERHSIREIAERQAHMVEQNNQTTLSNKLINTVDLSVNNTDKTAKSKQQETSKIGTKVQSKLTQTKIQTKISAENLPA